MLRRKKLQHLACIRVVGLGSGGGTAVSHLLAEGVQGVDCILVDSDVETLRRSLAAARIKIGGGAAERHGLDPSYGRRAALQSAGVLHDAIYGSDMVFLLAGLGGSTATGAAPVVARIAKDQKAVVIAIVTVPFAFEGAPRARVAAHGIQQLKSCVDTLIVVPNDRLLALGNGSVAFHETYNLALQIWSQSIRGISDMVNASGLVNLDFADVRTIIAEGGAAVITTGRGSGRNRARQAAQQATRSDLLGVTIDGARGVLFNITGADLTLAEVQEAATLIKSRIHPEANLIFGAVIDPLLGDEIHVTVVAAGFGAALPGPAAVPRPAPSPAEMPAA